MTKTQRRRKPARQLPMPLPAWNVILLDDDLHTFDYVVEMLMVLFRYTPEHAKGKVDEINTRGQAVVDTTTRERAELKQLQIHEFGRDVRLKASKASMTAIIQPA